MADDFRVAGGYVEVVARVNERTGREAAEKVTRDVERELSSKAPEFEGAGGRAGASMGKGLTRAVEDEVEKGTKRVREKVTKGGEDSGKGFLEGLRNGVKGFSGGFLSTLTLGFAGPGLSNAFQASPQVASIGLALAGAVVAVAAPAIGAGIVAALGVGSGLGVIIAGSILAFARDPKLKAAGADLGKTIMGVDTQPLQEAYDKAQANLTLALQSHSKTRIATAQKEAAETKKALADAQAFNENNASLPDLARGAFGKPLLDSIGQIKRAFIELTPSIKQVFDTVAPFIVPLTDGFIGLVKNALPGFLNFLKASGPSLTVFAQKLPEIGTALTKMFDSFAKGGPGAAKFLGDFIDWVARTIVVIGAIIGWLSRAYLAMRNFFTSIPGWVDAAGAWLASLPGKAEKALTALPGVVGGLIRSAVEGLVYWAGWGVGEAVKFVASLPGRIWNAITGIPDLISSLFRRAMSAGRGEVASGAESIVSTLWGLPGRLWSLGGSIISGLVNGIENAAGRLWNLAWSLAGRFLSGFKSALGISSPSKVMAELGEQGIGAGLIQGIDRSRKGAGGAAAMLADAVVRPFGALDVKPGAIAPAGASGPAGANGSFGPYVIELDGATVAAFVIDTVTGAPRAVAAAADEGRRQRGFVASRGRG